MAGFTAPAAERTRPSRPRAVHVDAAAYGNLRALDSGEPGLFNIADPGDEISSQKAIAQLGWRADSRIEPK